MDMDIDIDIDIDMHIDVVFQSLPRIPPGRVMRRRLLLECHSMMRICCPSMIWGNAGAILGLNLGATWELLGSMLGSYVGIILSYLGLLGSMGLCWGHIEPR